MRNQNQEDSGLPTYQVELTDVAKMEAEVERDRLASIVSLEYAERWFGGLLTAARSLPQLPRRWPLASENERYDVPVHRLLYKSGNTTHRLLFFVIEAVEDEMGGAVRVIHVFHGSAQGEGR